MKENLLKRENEGLEHRRHSRFPIAREPGFSHEPGEALFAIQTAQPNTYFRHILARSATTADEVEAGIEQTIERLRGSGHSLDIQVRDRMEQFFGTPLGDVRIHTDQHAAAMSRALNARAFTTGSDIFFGESEYQPGSSEGQKLLAHELTHVLQSRPRIQTKMRVSSPGDASELEAERMAEAYSGSLLQRSCGGPEGGCQCEHCRGNYLLGAELYTLLGRSQSVLARQEAEPASSSLLDILKSCFVEIGEPMLIGRAAVVLACLTPLLGAFLGPEADPAVAAAVWACLKITGIVLTLRQVTALITCFASKAVAANETAPSGEAPA